jgi:L-rhamnose-H+ transport protein
MPVILGVIFHFIGGFASGSFYIPYKKIKGWAWESYCIAGGLFFWLFVPFFAVLITVSHFLSIITFGLPVRYPGLYFGISVVLGFNHYDLYIHNYNFSNTAWL